MFRGSIVPIVTPFKDDISRDGPSAVCRWPNDRGKQQQQGSLGSHRTRLCPLPTAPTPHDNGRTGRARMPRAHDRRRSTALPEYQPWLSSFLAS